jgi:class 3 adenylate cyclase
MLSRKRDLLQPASEERLGKLIEERLRPGADKDRIDRRIWDLFGEEWCVMFTDLSGFSRNVVRFGIIHFLQTIFESELFLVPVIESHDGMLLKSEGDSFLVIFRNPEKGIRAAIEMQQTLAKVNLDRAAEEQILLCVGIGFGRVLRIGDSDVFGAQVNAASKLGEDTARTGEILVTGAVYERTRDLEGIEFVRLDDVPPGADAAWRVEYADAKSNAGGRTTNAGS